MKETLLSRNRLAEWQIANDPPQLSIIFFVVLYSILFYQAAFAEQLEVKADSLKSLFDYSNPYRGQSFTFPTGVKADKLTVYITPNIFQSFTFKLLLTEIETADGFHPTDVLFESEPFDIPLGGTNDIIPCTAELGGISLSGDKPYAFILDIYESLSEVHSDPLWQYSTSTGMNSGALFASGEYIYLDVDCIDSSGLPCGNREDHFAGSWVVDSSEDMGFILEYTIVAAPVSPAVLPMIDLLLLKGD